MLTCVKAYFPATVPGLRLIHCTTGTGDPGVKPVVIELTDAKTKQVVDSLEVDACLVATGRAPYTQASSPTISTSPTRNLSKTLMRFISIIQAALEALREADCAQCSQTELCAAFSAFEC